MAKGKLDVGYVHVYTGDGKGKTTAALGQAFRSVGHNMKAFMILFMKGNIEYGELETARRLAPFIEIREIVLEVHWLSITTEYSEKHGKRSHKTLLSMCTDGWLPKLIRNPRRIPAARR